VLFAGIKLSQQSGLLPVLTQLPYFVAPLFAGTKLSQQFSLSPVLTQLKGMLDELYRLVDETPAVQQSLRYGNPAFRTWFSSTTEKAPAMMQQVGSCTKGGWGVAVLREWPGLLGRGGG
jgi:hypothetical protein